jgi:hypothetical protein
MHLMIFVMNQCAKCDTTTDGGQFYRFYFGVVVDSVEAGPRFQASGSEEVYYCDRCLVRAAAREERIRIGLFLFLGLFGIGVLVVLDAASSRGLWFSLAALGLIAVLGGAAVRRYRCLETTLHNDNPDPIREMVRSNSKIQEMGDAWAIARRRQALLAEGAELFLTRSENASWSQD